LPLPLALAFAALNPVAKKKLQQTEAKNRLILFIFSLPLEVSSLGQALLFSTHTFLVMEK
jgi:hypothetical protein